MKDARTCNYHTESGCHQDPGRLEGAGNNRDVNSFWRGACKHDSGSLHFTEFRNRLWTELGWFRHNLILVLYTYVPLKLIAYSRVPGLYKLTKVLPDDFVFHSPVMLFACSITQSQRLNEIPERPLFVPVGPHRANYIWLIYVWGLLKKHIGTVTWDKGRSGKNNTRFEASQPDHVPYCWRFANSRFAD